MTKLKKKGKATDVQGHEQKGHDIKVTGKAGGKTISKRNSRRMGPRVTWEDSPWFF